MNEERFPQPDDLLARAEAALGRMPIPDGLSDDLRERTLAALRARSDMPSAHMFPYPRRKIIMTTLKIASALLVAGSGLLYFGTSREAEAHTAFAEATRKLQEARTLSFRITTKVEGIEAPMTVRLMYKTPGLVRSESEAPGKAVAIMDTIRGTTLVLDPAGKTALRLDGQPTQKPDAKLDIASGMAEDLRQLAGKEGEPVGEKTIGEVRAKGFRLKEQGQELTVWVDPKARLPLVVEMQGQSGGLNFRSTMDEFRLDPPLDDILFRLDVPEGYALRKAETKVKTPEDAVVMVLRTYAQATGGTFPTRLDDFNGYKKAFASQKPDRITQAELIDRAQALGRVAVLSFELEGRYGYKGEGVKFGDAKAIVFWYRPVNSTRYRAVYGDLHVGDVSADQLPVPPKS